MSVAAPAAQERRFRISVRIDPGFDRNPVLHDLVLDASGVLDQLVGDEWGPKASVWWRPSIMGLNGVKATLSLEDDSFDVDLFRSMLDDRESVAGLLKQLWSRLLQMRALRLQSFSGDADDVDPDRWMEGSEALDHLIDLVAEFTEREGRSPKSLRLPVRFAAALTKLGPSYWGGFYEKIRDSGLPAFDGHVFLGMNVSLVMGDSDVQFH